MYTDYINYYYIHMNIRWLTDALIGFMMEERQQYNANPLCSACVGPRQSVLCPICSRSALEQKSHTTTHSVVSCHPHTRACLYVKISMLSYASYISETPLAIFYK